MSRRRFSEKEVIYTLILQGIDVTCFRCGHSFNLWEGIEREHLHEIALDGADEPANCRYSCVPCHAKVTRGNGATTAGSSVNRIAKTKGTRAEKFAVVKLDVDKPRVKRRGFGGRLVKG